MNYPTAGGGGYFSVPGGGPGYPPGFGPASYYLQQQQQFDQFGNPLQSLAGQEQMYPQQVEGQMAPQFFNQQGQQGQQSEAHFIARDALNLPPNVGPPQNLMRNPGESGANSSGSRDRILRNPHPWIPISRTARSESEPYDPSLLTYNPTPMFPGPSYSATTSLNSISASAVTAPTISSIFQAAEEKISKMSRPVNVGQQQQAQTIVLDAPRPAPAAPHTSNTTASMEIITGIVTRMQDIFGMVSDEIFFQVSTIVGPAPNVGDKVVVEAERVSGMPFRFNGKRVQVVSKDLLKPSDPQQSEPAKSDYLHHNQNYQQQSGDRMDLKDKRHQEDLDFGPLPTMPSSLNLSQKPPPLKSILKRNAPPPPQISKPKNITSSTTPPPLKSILKRNAPPPPQISKPKNITSSTTSALGRFGSRDGDDQYRPESPGGFKNCSFSLDLRGDFPIIKQLSGLELLYPELMFVSDSVDQRRETTRGRKAATPPSGYARRDRSLSPLTSRRDRISRSPPPDSYRRRSRSLSPRRRVPISPKRHSRSPKRRPITPKRRSGSPRKRSLYPMELKRGPRISRPSITPKRSSPRKPSRSPLKRRSRSPKHTSPRRRSLSRSPGRRPGSLSRSPKRFRSPKSKSSARSGDEQSRKDPTKMYGKTKEPSRTEIQILSETLTTNDFVEEPHPFLDKCGIKGTVGSSSLFDRKKDPFQSQNWQNSAGKKGFEMSTTSSSSPLAPIKFSIGAQPQQQQQVKPTNTPKVRPAVAPCPPNQGGPRPVFIQNPHYPPLASDPQTWTGTVGMASNPRAIVQSVEQAIKKSKRKKVDSQEPASKVQTEAQKKAAAESDVQFIGQSSGVTRSPSGIPEALHEKLRLEMLQEERQLLQQKKSLEDQIYNGQLQALRLNVEMQLKSLRAKFDQHRDSLTAQTAKNTQQLPSRSEGLPSGSGKTTRNGANNNNSNNKRTERPPSSPEEIEKVKEEIQRQKFLEEERRLKSTGDNVGLERLWIQEDRRRRRVEEERLERVHVEEMKLKKDKNWTGLKKLGEEMGGTAEREAELMRLRELRIKEEMGEAAEQEKAQDEHSKWLQEEQEVYQRNEERAQRGQEGPLLRLAMDTELGQLPAADLLPEGPIDERYSSFHRGRKVRSRSSSQSGSRSDSRRHPSRRDERARHRGSSRSRSRDRSTRRRSQSSSRSRWQPSLDTRVRRTVDVLDEDIDVHRRSLEREAAYRGGGYVEPPPELVYRDRGFIENEEAAYLRERAAAEEEERIMVQLEEMRRQEWYELKRREFEIYQRIHMFETGYHQEPEAVDNPYHHHQQQQGYPEAVDNPYQHHQQQQGYPEAVDNPYQHHQQQQGYPDERDGARRSNSRYQQY